eukprot:jgi/Botrbrau1/10963/Bobra.0383s0017.1
MNFVLSKSYGPPRLEKLCIKTLLDYKGYISDIGDTPIALLNPVLQQCSAQQLKEIEDSTREGGRDLSQELNVHWKRCYKADFGLLDDGLQSQVAMPTPPAGNWRLGFDFRKAYEMKVEERQTKMRETGKRLRAMWEEDARTKASRSLQVIQPKPLPRRGARGP